MPLGSFDSIWNDVNGETNAEMPRNDIRDSLDNAKKTSGLCIDPPADGGCKLALLSLKTSDSKCIKLVSFPK